MATLFAGDLVDGVIKVRNIPASSANVQVTLGAAGSIGCSLRLPVRDPYTGVVIPFTDIVVPGKSYLAYMEGGQVLNAGPIWSDSYDFDSGKLTLAAAGLRSYWDYRFILPVLDDANSSDTPAGKTTTISGVSLRTIAKRWVAQAQAWTNGNVPVVLEADFAGTATRTFAGTDLKKLNEALSQLSGVIGGPDLAFRPRLTVSGNSLEWVMLTGDPELRQAGSDHVWDTTVPRSSVKGAKIVRDGSTLVTDDYEIGDTLEGASAPLTVKSVDATLTGQGYPRFESGASRSGVSITSTLQDYADGATQSGRSHLETWSFQARKSAAPAIGSYNEGDYGVLVTKNNPRVGTGRWPLRIMGYSAKKGDQFISLTCAPRRS